MKKNNDALSGKFISKFSSVNTVSLDETSTWQSIREIVYQFPNENHELMPGVKWGCFTQLYTPAFWKLQYCLSSFSKDVKTHRLSSNLIEEVVMCILGGFGIPSEMGLLAFERLKVNGLIRSGVSYSELLTAMSAPFRTEKGHEVLYRFHNQKAKYIHRFLERKDLNEIPENDDLRLRQWLLSVDGIGLKTASWVTRNWLNSNNIAILDVHVIRAGQLTGFFHAPVTSSFDYLELEKRYLAFCQALDVYASNMDAIIWYYMKKNTKLAIRHLFY